MIGSPVFPVRGPGAPACPGHCERIDPRCQVPDLKCPSFAFPLSADYPLSNRSLEVACRQSVANTHPHDAPHDNPDNLDRAHRLERFLDIGSNGFCWSPRLALTLDDRCRIPAQRWSHLVGNHLHCVAFLAVDFPGLLLEPPVDDDP